MKVVILAGGLGTRLSEETHLRPKPMIEIGGKPLLWHIMKIYSSHGLNDFIVCCGYKGYMIKEYFANYDLHMSEVTIDMHAGQTIVHQKSAEPWRVTLVDTGENTMTGGRLRRVRDFLVGEDIFCFTYGDGLSDLDVSKTIAFHRERGALATVTGIQPPGRFGRLQLRGEAVKSFSEKTDGDGSWINGGFFVLSPKVIEYIEGDQTVWEREPMEKLAESGDLNAFLHRGFWMPMDTLRDRNRLEELWSTGRAPWKRWS